MFTGRGATHEGANGMRPPQRGCAVMYCTAKLGGSPKDRIGPFLAGRKVDISRKLNFNRSFNIRRHSVN